MAKKKPFKKVPPQKPAEPIPETEKSVKRDTDPQAARVPPESSAPLPEVPTFPTNFDISRRDFLSRAGFAAAGICGATAMLGLLRGARSNTENRAELPTWVGKASDFKVNTVTFLKESNLFIVRDDAGVGAVSARCTHLGCTIRRVEDGFACPCHGAVFDTDGRPISGPARRALPWFAVTADKEGRLLVQLSKESNIPGPSPLALPAGEAL